MATVPLETTDAQDLLAALSRSEERRHELEDAVRALEAMVEVALAIGTSPHLQDALDLIAAHARALTGARCVVISLVEDREGCAAASDGDAGALQLGARYPLAGSIAEAALRRGGVVRMAACEPPAARLASLIGLAGDAVITAVPLGHGGEPFGVIAVIDAPAGSPALTHDRGRDGHDLERERIVEGFAAAASVAIAAARGVGDRRMRTTLRAQEAERRRWARELHDDTLQHLAALNLELAAARRQTQDPVAARALERAMREAKEQVQGLRALITELRPQGLDELGLAAALEDLCGRVQTRSRIPVARDVVLPGPRQDPDVETAIYRIVQEALTNAVRHGGATRINVQVEEADGLLDVRVHDNGVGFDPAIPTTGFGLEGMRERAALLGGRLSLHSDAGGTTIHAHVPLPGRADTEASR